MENSTISFHIRTRLIDHDMLIDWFQFTLFGMDIEKVIELVFDTDITQMVHTMHGLNGYNETYTFGRKMHVMINRERPTMGINVMFSGSACREYEEIFDLKDLFKKLSNIHSDLININRIDIAIDYFGNKFNVRTIENKVNKELVTSRFKSCSVLYEKLVKGERLGEQVTFGRKISDLHIVFYNKKLEREELGYKFNKEIKYWTRCELRFRHNNANALFKNICQDDDNIGKYVKGVLRQYLSFKVNSSTLKSNLYRQDECKWWIDFTNNVPKLKLEKESYSSSIVKKRDYVEAKLSKMIALMHVADDTFISKCISKGVDKLDEDDWLLLNSYFLNNNMPFMSKEDLEKIIENYKKSKNVKI